MSQASPTIAAIACVSTAAYPFTAEALEALLVDEGNFFQYIEGPWAGLRQVYDRICRSRQHDGILQVLNRELPERQFEQWSMGFTRTPERLPLRLSQAVWAESLQERHAHPGAESPAMGLLLNVWSQANRR